MKRHLTMAATLLAAMTLTVPASACMCIMPPGQPVQILVSDVALDITDGLAVKRYELTFYNPSTYTTQPGTVYLEIEPGAKIDNMSVIVNGKELKAEILDVNRAKQVFQDLLKKGGSPAMLDSYGNQLVRMQIPRIGAKGKVKVKFSYTTLLKKRGDLYRITMLNTNPKGTQGKIQTAKLTVNIKSRLPVKNVYSPTHAIEATKGDAKWDATFSWKANNFEAKKNFVLYFQTAKDDVAATVLTNRELDEDGTFMLMLSPTVGNAKRGTQKVLPKDIVFCVDTSSSMRSKWLDKGASKMDQARAALQYCVKNLRKGDRFNIVGFSHKTKSFHQSGLIEFNDESMKKALEFVKNLRASGGTNIEKALSESINHLKGDSDRLKMIVFSTDGRPTFGERDPQKLLKSIKGKNPGDIRLFVFGEGYDINTKLLDLLAIDHRGEADYILPEENIHAKISQFFDRVGSPLMTDLKVEIAGLETYDVYPKQIPDVYRGEQVVIYGRYRGNGSKKVTLKGKVAGKETAFSYDLKFPEFTEDDSAAFVPRLWAGKKVDELLNELRAAAKPDDKKIKEVTTLAKRFGIITPYTNFVVTENLFAQNNGNRPFPAPGVLLRDRIQRGVWANGAKGGGGFGGGRGRPGGAPPAAFGPAEPADDKAKAESSVKAAKKLAETRKALGGKSGAGARFDAEADEYLEKTKEYRRNKNQISALKYVAGRAYYCADNTWYDSRYNAKVKVTKTVKIGSDEYFTLLKKQPKLRNILALGNVVILVGKDWVRFTK